MRTWVMILAMGAVGLTAAACTGTEGGADDTAASVQFDTLKDGDKVTSPVNICLSAVDITIEPKGAVKPGSGHHHIVVDASEEELAAYEMAGSVIPTDDTHIHMGDGAACKDVELTAGTHTLTAIVADGAHMTLSPSVMTSVEVEVTP
ncbi:MAG: DUF4399 domain-containing protein [Ardenticatenales bacterium]|nr:DUF4399 domain-containing protein [Ardenticatenales bacterium]